MFQIHDLNKVHETYVFRYCHNNFILYYVATFTEQLNDFSFHKIVHKVVHDAKYDGKFFVFLILFHFVIIVITAHYHLRWIVVEI